MFDRIPLIDPLRGRVPQICFLSLVIGGLLYDQALGNPVYPKSGRSQGELTILYDNNAYDVRLKSSWDFWCLIEVPEKTILFDTGGNAEILLYNMKVLNKDLEMVDMTVLSHIHGDHTGGLWGLLEEKSLGRSSMGNAEKKLRYC